MAHLPQTFSALHIDRRVLTTPSRTIAIANIATVGVGTHVEHRNRTIYWIAALLLALVAADAGLGGLFFPEGNRAVSAAFSIAAVVIAVVGLKPDDKTHYLLVASNDGIVTRFTGIDSDVLEEARRLLTDKINTGNEAATYNINFASGLIENLSDQGAPAYVPPSAAYTNGSAQPKPQPYTGNGGAPAQPRASLSAASGIQQRPAAPEAAGGGWIAANGNGQTAQAEAASPAAYVDFSAMLPPVVEMHRFYARQPNVEHLEQRLSELELLMRAGAQTGTQKIRVRELSSELAHILQAYPPAVQVFRQISGMVGV